MEREVNSGIWVFIGVIHSTKLYITGQICLALFAGVFGLFFGILPQLCFSYRKRPYFVG